MRSPRGLSRRRFVSRGATAAAACAAPWFIPASALGLAEKPAPSNRVAVGMIGLGRQALGRNLPVFMNSADCQVVALCDVDRWRLDPTVNPLMRSAAKQHGWSLDRLAGCFRTTDFRQVLARQDVDAVLISTPDHWHVPIALAAIRAGKDVACEKPIGLCIAHGRILADAAARSKCVFRTDSEFRSVPVMFRAVSLVRTGKIGQLRTMRMAVPCWNLPLPMQPEMPVPEELDYDLWLGPAPARPYTEQRVHPRKAYSRPGWYANQDYCDGVISNWGYHPADIAQWANNTERSGPVEIEGRGEFPPADGLWNVMLGFEVRYRYANGVELHYTAVKDPTNSSGAYVRFEGTEGWIHAHYGPDTLEAEPKSILTATINPADFPFPLKNEKRDFIDCVKTRARTLEDAEVGHRSSTVGQLGYLACRLARKLTWDPAREHFVGDPEADRLLTRPMRSPWLV